MASTENPAALAAPRQSTAEQGVDRAPRRRAAGLRRRRAPRGAALRGGPVRAAGRRSAVGSAVLLDGRGAVRLARRERPVAGPPCTGATGLPHEPQ